MKTFTFALLIFFLNEFFAEGNYVMNIRIYSFSHTNRRDYEGNYCDVFSSNPCEDKLLFCLQQHGTSQFSTICHYGFFRSGTYTQTSITFSEGSNIFAQGVHNPLVFSGTQWPMNFQFQVRVDDDDSPDSDDLIDRVFIVGTNVAISETYTQSQTYTGIYNNVQMDMSYRVVCQTNYYGSTCNVNCEGRDDDLGHYECNSDGDRVCLSGWTGLPNCLTPVCSPACPANSVCSSPGTCTCVAGWSGDNCTQCIPATGCDHGECVNPGECVCDTGYSGTLCQVDIDVCGHQTPCQNGGTCSNTGPDSHMCECPSTFTGPNCEEDVDECLTDPCLNGGTCINNHGDDYTCVCPAGYTDPDCGTEIDECDSSPCQNGATCTDLLDDFNCTCSLGFTGAVCDVNIDDCHPDLCLHDGTCVDQIASYSCECLPKYTGTQCEDELPPPCSADPCSPGITFCVENIEQNTYTCEDCMPGVEGCDNFNIIDPDAQHGNNGTNVKPVNAPLIGGIIGGVVAALLLLCLFVAMVVLCLRCCACCPCVCLRSKEDETYEAIGTSAQQNPLYLGTSTLLSNQSGTLRSSSATMPRYDGETQYVEFSDGGSNSVEMSSPRQHANPMYAMAQVAIYNGTPPTLPAPRTSIVGRPVSPDHYERLPGETKPKEVVASGKYDRLKPEPSKTLAQSGKYDSLSPVSAPPAIDNHYVIDQEDGYKVIPGPPRPLDAGPPCQPDASKPTSNETLNAPLPPRNFNPYD